MESCKRSKIFEKFEFDVVGDNNNNNKAEARKMEATMDTKRFASATEDEIREKKTNINSKNTLKANKKAARILRDYLIEKNLDPAFEKLDKNGLNNILEHFYVNARKTNWEKYKPPPFTEQISPVSSCSKSY